MTFWTNDFIAKEWKYIWQIYYIGEWAYCFVKIVDKPLVEACESSDLVDSVTMKLVSHYPVYL